MKSLFNRRQFLAASAALPFALRSVAQAERAPRYLLLGTDTGKGIYRAPWNALTGEIGPSELAVATDRPAYFAMHPHRPILYAANEATTGDGSLSSFRLDAKSATLEPIQRISTLGSAPCYVSVDETGKSAFVANYLGGNVTAFGLKPDGRIAPGSSFNCIGNLDCGVPGPVTARQDGPHMHCAVLSPDNRFLIACNLGEDAIEVFPITPGTVSSEVLGAPQRFAARSGSGPRHVAFHPSGRWLYCIHELDCTLDIYNYNKGALTLLGGSTVSTLAADTAPTNTTPKDTACEVLVSHDGRFVYANTRGADTLAVYRVNPKTGFLTEQQRVQTGGTVTRLLAFDPSHQWLLCLNQGSSTITVFAHDAKTGKLTAQATGKPRTFGAETPMCVEWV